MKNIIFCLVLILIAFTPNPASAYSDDYSALLKSYVKPINADLNYNGVDYDSWGKDSRHKKILNNIQNFDVSSLKTTEEKLAFWINVYNILTIDLIIKTGERKSIKNLGSFLISPWKHYSWKIGLEEYTLDNIEHDIIRKFGDPRIHFAVNCAAKSCPDLRNEAYTAGKLDNQLNDQVTQTLSNKTKGFLKATDENSVKVTKVMKWYDEDFDQGNLNTWLQKKIPEHINDKTNITFFNYDWSLNKQ